MTTPSPPPSSISASPTPRTLKRVCTVVPVLRFVRIDSISDVIKIAHISSTFGDALESYSATVWQRITACLEVPALAAIFRRNVFAWVAQNLLTVGRLDVSRWLQHPLLVAAWTGAVDIVRVCLAAIPACIDVRGHNGRTALQAACYDCHTECVRVLIAAGANITIADDSGWTALHEAATQGCIAIVRLLIAHPDCAKICDKGDDLEGQTPLHAAARDGHIQCVCELLAAGVDITVTDDYGSHTAEDYAVQNGHADVVRLLRDVRNRKTSMDKAKPMLTKR